MNTLVTKQYVEDALGGPGADFIPLTGTEVAKEVTGVIEFKSTALGLDYSFGIEAGITDRMSISGGEFVVATGANALGQWWNFNADGQLIMPDVDYSAANAQAAVTKQYVDDAVAGGGSVNTFVPLAGTDVDFPITGTIQFENIALNRKFSLGIQNLPGFQDSFTIASDGSSGNPSNIRLVTSGVVHSFEPTGFTTQDVHALGALTVDGVAQLAAGLVTTGVIADGAVFNENVETYGTLTSVMAYSTEQSNGPGSTAETLTRKDYVDFGLATKADTNTTMTAGDGLTGGGSLLANRTFNVDSTVARTTGSQTLSSKTLSSPALTGSVNVNSLATSTSTFAMVQSGGIMYRGPAVAPAAAVIDVLNDIADILNLTPTQRSAITAAINTRIGS